MSVFLIVAVVLFSGVASALFVIKDAKKFAISPPTPLIDLDRMYDSVFIQLDEVSGSAITPKELLQILDAFINSLNKDGLVKENIVPDQAVKEVKVLEANKVVEDLLDQGLEVEVLPEIIENVIELAFAYLQEIKAVS